MKKKRFLFILFELVFITGMFFLGRYLGNLASGNDPPEASVDSVSTKELPPADPPYPSEAEEDWARFDNETVAVLDEEKCVLTYADGTEKTAVACTEEDIHRLNQKLDSLTAENVSWINLHSGTCLIVYKFVDEGVNYEYYQHLVDWEHIFVWKSGQGSE